MSQPASSAAAPLVLRLPLHEGERCARECQTGPSDPAFHGRALLVEDDGLVRRTVGRMLEIGWFRGDLGGQRLERSAAA